jgi:hypothetical protein
VAPVTRQELIKKLNDLFDKMETERSFGNITIAFRNGDRI